MVSGGKLIYASLATAIHYLSAQMSHCREQTF